MQITDSAARWAPCSLVMYVVYVEGIKKIDEILPAVILMDSYSINPKQISGIPGTWTLIDIIISLSCFIHGHFQQPTGFGTNVEPNVVTSQANWVAFLCQLRLCWYPSFVGVKPTAIIACGCMKKIGGLCVLFKGFLNMLKNVCVNMNNCLGQQDPLDH